MSLRINVELHHGCLLCLLAVRLRKTPTLCMMSLSVQYMCLSSFCVYFCLLRVRAVSRFSMSPLVSLLRFRRVFSPCVFFCRFDTENNHVTSCRHKTLCPGLVTLAFEHTASRATVPIRMHQTICRGQVAKRDGGDVFDCSNLCA